MANTNFEKSKEWEVSSARLNQAHGYAADADVRKEFEEAHEQEALALEILDLAQNTLLINLRFMEAAFVKLSPQNGRSTASAGGTASGDAPGIVTLEIATDGQFLYYSPIHVCRQFKRAKEIPVRDYLHVVLHCLFRHFFIGKNIRADVWDLACDIAVENMITNMDLRSLRCERQTDQAWIIRQLSDEVPRLSAEWIYKHFMEKDPSPEEIARLEVNFHADDHAIWHSTARIESGNGDPGENEAGDIEGDMTSDTEMNTESKTGSEDDDGEEGESAKSEDREFDAIEGSGEDGIGSGGDDESKVSNDTPALTPEECKEEWEEIARRIEVDLDTSSDSWGAGAGDMQQTLREINREKCDYTSLLKRFAVIGENVEVNDDEFDYIFYTYGMKLYENMPLVEPLEYKDVKKVREFVIALDTSESVSGEIVQKFVAKTWNILKQSENFFRHINVHIIQCGARIEEDVRITTEEEFDEYIKNMVLKGFGGTDFRPVFEHVDTLIRQKEFTNFKGLIYFTDGFGTFPANPPEYDAAFIFLDQGYELPDVPAWVIKMVLKEDEIIEF